MIFYPVSINSSKIQILDISQIQIQILYMKYNQKYQFMRPLYRYFLDINI